MLEVQISLSALELFSAREEIIGVHAVKIYQGRRNCRSQRLERGQRLEEPRACHGDRQVEWGWAD
jgi:hypothetical protein